MAYCDMTDLPEGQCAHCVPKAADKLTVVRELALELMREHGLLAAGWTFKFDSAKSRLGQCNYRKRTIALTESWAEVSTLEDTRNTIIHEIAHALLEPTRGHDAVWEAKARALGHPNPGARSRRAGVKIAYAAVGTCPAGHVTRGHRLPRTVSSCKKCVKGFSSAHLFTWTFNGKPAVMGAQYREGLAEMRELIARGELA